MKQFLYDISRTALGVFIGGGTLIIAIQIYDSYKIHRTPSFGFLQNLQIPMIIQSDDVEYSRRIQRF